RRLAAPDEPGVFPPRHPTLHVPADERTRRTAQTHCIALVAPTSTGMLHCPGRRHRRPKVARVLQCSYTGDGSRPPALGGEPAGASLTSPDLETARQGSFCAPAP